MGDSFLMFFSEIREIRCLRVASKIFTNLMNTSNTVTTCTASGLTSPTAAKGILTTRPESQEAAGLSSSPPNFVSSNTRTAAPTTSNTCAASLEK